MMYEIWSLGYKPFESYTNPDVKQRHGELSVSNSLCFVTGDQDGGQRSLFPSTSWTHKRTLQDHDTMLVSSYGIVYM